MWLWLVRRCCHCSTRNSPYLCLQVLGMLAEAQPLHQHALERPAAQRRDTRQTLSSRQHRLLLAQPSLQLQQVLFVPQLLLASVALWQSIEYVQLAQPSLLHLEHRHEQMRQTDNGLAHCARKQCCHSSSCGRGHSFVAAPAPAAKLLTQDCGYQLQTGNIKCKQLRGATE